MGRDKWKWYIEREWKEELEKRGWRNEKEEGLGIEEGWERDGRGVGEGWKKGGREMGEGWKRGRSNDPPEGWLGKDVLYYQLNEIVRGK